jgi:hypothetical protein
MIAQVDPVWNEAQVAQTANEEQLCVFRLMQLETAVDGLQCCSLVAQRGEDHAQITVRRRQVLLEVSPCTSAFAPTSQIAECGASIVRSDRLADKSCCRGAVADLMGEHAEKMKAVEVVWVDRENFPVVGLGFCELARLVMPLPSSQQLTNLVRGTNDRGRRHRSRSVLAHLGCYSPLFSVHRKAFDR